MLKIKFNQDDSTGSKNVKKIQVNSHKQKEKFAQEILGIKEINDNSVTVGSTTDEDSTTLKYYIRLNPKNINIMMPNVLFGLIDNLKRVLNISLDTEILVVDKTERVDDNKDFLKELIERNNNPVFKEILRKDLNNLNKEFSRSSSREFYIILPYKNVREHEQSTQMERSIEMNGFDVIETKKDDIKNMLQVYLERNFSNVVLNDYDI